jgi:hypothetical protein
MPQRFVIAALAFASAAVFAQAAPVQDSQPLDPKKNQKVERIHVEDGKVAIDETRYAGQTENVTVQPKNGLPAYEIVPANPARAQVYEGRGGSKGAGERVWNLFSF